MTIIEKIRAKVERLYDEANNYDDSRHYLGEVLSFLSDIEKEEKPSEGLEEEIKSFAFSFYQDNGNLPMVADIARHFAKWQKEQMMDEWLKDRDGCFWDGVEEGKKAMREQMMKEAVEGDVFNAHLHNEDDVFVQSDYLSKEQFKPGERVKMIIIKGDEL